MKQPGLRPRARALGVLALVAGGCPLRSTATPADETWGAFAAGWLALGEEAGAWRGLPARRLRSETWEAFAKLTAQLERAGSAATDDDARLAAWHTVVFGRWSFTVLPAAAASTLRAILLPQLLAQRRGSCLGLGSLYLALGEALGLPLRGVLVPGHFFVRLERRGAAAARNLELLAGGYAHDDDWYRRSYGVPAHHPLYLRSLAATESLAVLRYELANALRRSGALRAARAHYALVVAALPDFAEAQANLGLTEQLLGHDAAAARAYRRALRAGAPPAGITRNLQRLAPALRPPPPARRGPAAPAASGSGACPDPTPDRPRGCPRPDGR